MKTKYSILASILVLFLIVLIMTSAEFTGKKTRADKNSDDLSLPVESKQYVCSMHPQVIRNEPGDCPICGMFLIEKIENDLNGFDTSLTNTVCSVNETVLSSMRSIMPEFKPLQVVIEASGIINYDPRSIQTVSARFGGLIEKSFVKYQFQHIRKGQKIFEIYSPDIYEEQWNYVKLIQAFPDRDDLTIEALEWFRLLGLSKGQVDSLKHVIKPNYHLPVYSSAEGYAVSSDFDPETFFFTGNDIEDNPETFLAGTGSIDLNDGITVETGAPLFKLIDINALRVDLKVKTENGPLLKKGQKVIITDAAYPDRHFNATISQIEPLNSGLFQSVKIYLRDDERFLLPGRQIEARIVAGDHEGLWVPASAVVDMGQHQAVFVLDGNKYVATEVFTGLRTNGKIEIIYGIDENSMIAEKALLLTDSDGFISLN